MLSWAFTFYHEVSHLHPKDNDVFQLLLITSSDPNPTIKGDKTPFACAFNGLKQNAVQRSGCQISAGRVYQLIDELHFSQI